MNDVKSVLQILFSKEKSPESNLEQGRSQPSHQSMSTTLPVQEVQLPHIDHGTRPNISPDDQLNLFRHLVGISSHPSMTHSHPGDELGGRPAPNLGIYARIVHKEKDSKIGYKHFSWLINGCLGLQIIIAAALTALGAAGASHSAITVFGAINTVIAGILTFLKGSGLPNRLKYYQTEWKRVREFIEQRERDFARPGCDLDLHKVVAMVENMYDEVKIDLEASTPDRFAGFSSAKKRQAQEIEVQTTGPMPNSLPRTTTEPLGEKFFESGFGSRVKDLASDIGQKADMARTAVNDFQARKEHVAEDTSREVKGYAERAEKLETNFGERVKDLASDIGERARLAQDAVSNTQARQRNDIEEMGTEARKYAEQFEPTASGKFKGPLTINLSGSTASPADMKEEGR